MTRCAHCGQDFDSDEPRRLYCSEKCVNASKLYRRYHRLKVRGLLRDRRAYLRAWRERVKLEGRCPKCGDENDRRVQGYAVCSTCTERRKRYVE